jgi:hypothetical protein
MLDYTRELTEAERCIRVEREYNNACVWYQKNWDRIVENWRFYWGIDSDKGLGQWPGTAVTDMLREGRQVAVYNIVRPTVDNIAGGIMKAPWSFDFTPVDDDISSLTHATKDVHYIDKELTGWRPHELEMVIGGLVGQSVMEMYINREYNKKHGNIGMKTCLPGSVKFDPYHKSARSKDCKKAYREVFLTPLEMLKLYTKKNAEIKKSVYMQQYGESALEKLAEYQAMYGDEYGVNWGIMPTGNEAIWGSQYKVIEFYEMQTIKRTYEYVVTEDDEEIVIPGDLEEPSDKIAWLNDNIPGWIPDQVFSDETEEEIQYKTVICPSLSTNMILAYGPTEIQCGRLQFFPWSAARVNGEFGGVVDLIKDAQKNINYWESLITHKIQVEGGGGAQFCDEGAFPDNSGYLDYVANRGNPKKVFKLRRDYLKDHPSGPAIPVVKSPFPAEAMKHLEHMIQVVLPKISKVTTTAHGQSETSNESGYLFQLKKLQSDIEQYVIYESLRNFWNEVGEAYLSQAINTYGNMVERTFYNHGKKKSFTINKRETRTDVNGNQIDVIINDFSKLREMRHRVIVTESQDSPTRKVEIMQVASSLIKSMPQEMTLHRMELANTLSKQLDTFDEAQRQVLDDHFQKEIKLAAILIDAQIAEAETRIAVAHANAQPKQMAPAGAEGQTGQTSQAGQAAKQPMQLSPAPGSPSGQPAPSPMSSESGMSMQPQGELVAA